VRFLIRLSNRRRSFHDIKARGPKETTFFHSAEAGFRRPFVIEIRIDQADATPAPRTLSSTIARPSRVRAHRGKDSLANCKP
jgi:hypothetical protein